MTRLGEQLTIDEILAATAKAVPTWTDRAHRAIDQLAATGRPFTADDITRLIGLPRPDEGVNRNNAVGAVFRAAARRGVIVRVGFTQSGRTRSHGRVLAEWQGT